MIIYTWNDSLGNEMTCQTESEELSTNTNIICNILIHRDRFKMTDKELNLRITTENKYFKTVMIRRGAGVVSSIVTYNN